jgi:hypothetical protein
MTGADVLPATVLKRKAIVYVRQSTQTQVQTNLESQRRQYELVDEARRRGFRDVEVIDDDLGRSASGTMARPGFDRLVAWLCAGDVGAVLCFDASRLAATGATGITFWSFAVLWARASSISTGSMTRAAQTTDSCWV